MPAGLVCFIRVIRQPEFGEDLRDEWFLAWEPDCQYA